MVAMRLSHWRETYEEECPRDVVVLYMELVHEKYEDY